MSQPTSSTPPTSRRDFLKTGAAAGVALTGALGVSPYVHAAGGETLRVALIGCGKRGTGAASQALNADKDVKLVAMADAFDDRIQASLETLRRDKEVAAKVDVKPENCFVGFDAYKEVLKRDVDVVLLATPPHFRPEHLRASVEAGKHIFAEKPVAVDAPGVRSVLASCELAKKKGLSVVSGLCLRYHNGFGEAIRRIHQGEVGEVFSVQANDYRGSNWSRARQPGWTDMEYQMRNWYNYTWLSGDFNVEQHVHFLDIAAWVMQDQYPVQAMGMGGRQVRSGPEFGHIYDHFSVIYEYANGSKIYSNCRQQRGCKGDISAQVQGSKGRVHLSERRNGVIITAGGKEWRYTGANNDIYQTEHDELFKSIRSGKPINNGEYMTKSTLLAIMGRMSAYTGQLITWDMAMNSKEELKPPKYDWNVPLPEPEVAMPGVTKFI